MAPKRHAARMRRCTLIVVLFAATAPPMAMAKSAMLAAAGRRASGRAQNALRSTSLDQGPAVCRLRGGQGESSALRGGQGDSSAPTTGGSSVPAPAPNRSKMGKSKSVDAQPAAPAPMVR